MITQVAFEHIEDEYWYVGYGPFRVVMDITDGYINATKMCLSGAKNYYHWSRLKSSHELIQLLQKE